MVLSIDLGIRLFKPRRHSLYKKYNCNKYLNWSSVRRRTPSLYPVRRIRCPCHSVQRVHPRQTDVHRALHILLKTTFTFYQQTISIVSSPSNTHHQLLRARCGVLQSNTYSKCFMCSCITSTNADFDGRERITRARPDLSDIAIF